MEEKENFKHIIRVMSTDLKGNKGIMLALQKITGVSDMFANMICKKAKIDKTKIAGKLSSEEVKNIEDIFLNLDKHKVPKWMYNRRKDYETGKDIHLITSDLKFTKQNDIKRMQMTKSYKGLRHAARLPLRGQRTKSNFRNKRGKSLGVKRKK